MPRRIPANQAFLAWLLKNTPAMELYLEGVVPIGLAAREANTYTLDTAALEIWKKILDADPDAKDGLYLKLAIATAIAPPGSVNIGAGGAETPADPVVRYQYYKTAHKNKELFPSFDNLTVWEYSKIVSSGASDADLTWAREMINTFRPDLRADEMVVNSTSLVWRRSCAGALLPRGRLRGLSRTCWQAAANAAPGRRGRVMVCQAFGIPAIGVGQPAHACVAYKAANPMTEPQPGSAWKVGYGRGWEVSKLEGMKGPDFLAGVEKRSRCGEVLAGGTPALAGLRAGCRPISRRGHGGRPQDPRVASGREDRSHGVAQAGRGGSRSRRQGRGKGRTTKDAAAAVSRRPSRRRRSRR